MCCLFTMGQGGSIQHNIPLDSEKCCFCSKCWIRRKLRLTRITHKPLLLQTAFCVFYRHLPWRPRMLFSKHLLWKGEQQHHWPLSPTSMFLSVQTRTRWHSTWHKCDRRLRTALLSRSQPVESSWNKMLKSWGKTKCPRHFTKIFNVLLHYWCGVNRWAFDAVVHSDDQQLVVEMRFRLLDITSWLRGHLRMLSFCTVWERLQTFFTSILLKTLDIICSFSNRT